MKYSYRLNYTLLGLIAFLILINLILLSQNNRMNYELYTIQQNLKVLEEENKELSTILIQKTNLNKVSEIAEGRLQMVFPKKVEYIYE